MTRSVTGAEFLALSLKVKKRGPSKAVRTGVPLADTDNDQYPKVCFRCGKNTTRAGGVIEQRGADGTYSIVCAGCVTCP